MNWKAITIRKCQLYHKVSKKLDLLPLDSGAVTVVFSAVGAIEETELPRRLGKLL